MDEFRLKVTTEDYVARINDLEDYLGALKEHLSDYNTMRNDASNVISSNFELQQIQKIIDGQSKRVENAIFAVETQIKTLRNLVENYDNLLINVTGIIEGAIDIVNMFD